MIIPPPPFPRFLEHSLLPTQLSPPYAGRPPVRTKSRRIPIRAVLKVIACIAVVGYTVILLRLLASGVEVRHPVTSLHMRSSPSIFSTCLRADAPA